MILWQNPLDNDYLVQVCLKAFDEIPNIKETFFGQLMKQQLLCATSVLFSIFLYWFLECGVDKLHVCGALQESGRAFRWSKEIVHWALTLQFHGGKRIISDLRGKANAGAGKHGDLKIDVSKWGLFLPADSTLRNYLPPVEVYTGFDEKVIANFKEAFPKESPRKIIIAWDEIEIRYGLVWNPSTKELIGKATGPIAEKNAKKEIGFR